MYSPEDIYKCIQNIIVFNGKVKKKNQKQLKFLPREDMNDLAKIERTPE